MNGGTARFAREGDTWILKLQGDVRHPLSPAINALLDRAFADPSLRHFLVDLSETDAIDSTNLGVLARIANHMEDQGLPRPTLIAPGADIQTVLRFVCFDRVLHLVTESGETRASLESLPEVDAEERAMLALVLDAHRRLCAMDDHNRAVFQDVVELMERELGNG
jgi:anti-anti-sigma factor